MLGNIDNWLGCAEEVLRCLYSMESPQRSHRYLWRCEQIVDSALRINPDNPQGNYLKGVYQYAFQYGGNEEALQYLENAVRLDPHNVEYREDRDLVQRSVDAEREYRQAHGPLSALHGIRVF